MEKSEIRMRRVLQELEYPPRPNLVLGHAIHACNQNSAKVVRLTWNWGDVRTDIDKFEIFVCIQPHRSTVVSNWTKIGEIIYKGRNDEKSNNSFSHSAFLGSCSDARMIGHSKSCSKRTISRRIVGVCVYFEFYHKYRNQNYDLSSQ